MPKHNWSSLREMTSSMEYEQFREQLYLELQLLEPERADRIKACAKDGAEGSTHGEILLVQASFLRMMYEERKLTIGCYYQLLGEVDDMTQWHIDNGSLDEIVG